MKKISKHLRSLSSLCVPAALSLLFHTNSHAQSLPIDAYVSMAASAAPGTVTANYFVEVSDTNDISQIEIVPGASMGGNEYLSQVINFNGSNLPSGFSLSRTANIVHVGIGTVAANAAYYGQVRLKSNNGSWSPYYTFVSN